MASVALRLLGTFQGTIGGQPITGFATDKVRALFCYLALEAGYPHMRSALAALLWPHLSQDHAGNNLRKSLHRLRQTLDKVAPGASSIIAITRQTVQFVATEAIVDVLTMKRLLAACQTHEHADLRTCDSCLERMAQAAELYQGELLAGLSLADAPAFEEWLLYWRESVYQQTILTLSTLSAAYEGRGDLGRADTLTSHLLALDPYREEAQRQKMRLLAKMGLPNQALEQYETFRRLLKEEMGVEVDSATAALAQQIRSKEVERQEPPEALTSFIPQPRSSKLTLPSSTTLQILEDVPQTGRLYGRQHEVERLTHWLTQEHSRLITIVGMGGIGKTTLAAAAARSVAGHFDVVLWRSVINAPPLEEILRDWLDILSDYRLAPLPKSLDGQLALLLEHLRNRRCLLVLDNLESIFQPDRAGHMRPEHHGYTQLLQRIAETLHQSCLLLTSRERPQGFTRLEEDLPWVRTLTLDGLDIRAAEAMLFERGLTGERGATVSLVERYSGNPLALKLVAEIAQELFGGDVAAFSASDTLIFDDIRAVLDRQFDRLPPLEQEILIWLAVEREPLSMQSLRDNLSPPRPPADVLAAIRGLQRRSLIDRVEAPNLDNRLGSGLNNGFANAGQPAAAPKVSAFMLQNVLMEYLIDRLVEAACREIEQENLVRLHHHALIKAQAKEYVRQSQVRLILQPVANRLLASFSIEEIGNKISRLLTALRDQPAAPGGYAAGSLLNLLLLLEIDPTGYDFSHLRVWQTDLRHAQLPAVNFTGADLTRSYFVDGFGFVFDVAYSPDGALLAAATGSGELRLWQATDARLLHVFTGHQGTVRSLAFSPDGALLASGGEDNTVRIWNLLGPKMQAAEFNPSPQILRGHSGRVTSVAFHPDGKRLASAGVDQDVRLWDLATGETTAILQGHGGWIWSLTFHPNGATLASAGEDQTIRLWDVERATERALLLGHTGAVTTLSYDRQGSTLASGSHDYSVRLWDVESGQTLHLLQASLDIVFRVAFSPDGSTLATTGDEHITRIWETQSGNILNVLHGHEDTILALAFSPDGRTLVTGSADNTMQLWDLPSQRLRQIISGHNQSVVSLTYHPDGRRLLSATYDSTLRLWDLEHRTISQTVGGRRHGVSAVAVSRDGAWLASGGDNLELWEFDAEGRAHCRHLLHPHRGQIFVLAFSPNGSILASGGIDQTVYLWDVKSGQLRQTLPSYELHVYAIQFSPDGSLLATGSVEQSIRLWDPHTAHLYHQWQAHANVVHTVAFTPDGQTLISGGGDGLICLWDIRAPAQPHLQTTLHGHTDRVFSIAVSADGKRLYSGSADRTIRVWDMQSPQPMQTLHGHTHWVWTLSLSPDGKTLVSGSADETIRLWETQSGECLAILVAPGPYEGMNIRDVRGITEAEKTTLKRLGAVEG